jgi:hypothetical protein
MSAKALFWFVVGVSGLVIWFISIFSVYVGLLSIDDRHLIFIIIIVSMALMVGGAMGFISTSGIIREGRGNSE